MNLFSPVFLGFFSIVLILYYTVADRYQKVILFLSSSLFIAFFSFNILLYTYLFIISNYLFALLIKKYAGRKNIKRVICNTGILSNIGALVFFKYLNFLFGTISQLLHLVNFSIPEIHLKTILPIGISYYTFQGISYLLQVYRGNEKVENNIITFSLYFIFFPKFLAGPIELSKTFIPQLKKRFTFNYEDVVGSFLLILWGAFKKMVIADRLSIIIDGVYPNLHELPGNMLLITFLLQPMQIYCDFSGYTDIALGIGKSFGFNLTNNFNRPFFSTSVTMFWQRWHISLSGWCNEFIFKRLSFKKRRWGIWASVYAVFVTFLIIGIWHGPRWTFIILGLLQALAINYEFFTKKIRLKLASKLPKKLVLYGSYLLVYLFFCFTLVFFYAADLPSAKYFISNIFTQIDLTNFNLTLLDRFDKEVLFFSLLFLIIVEFRQEFGKNVFSEMTLWPNWVRIGFFYILAILIIYFGSPVREFVYMQF